MRILLATMVLAVLSIPAQAQDKPAKAAACAACHGAGGAAPIAPNYPKLNGQNKEYLVSSIKAYRSGERKGGLAAVMASQATQLTDEDINALAAYYAAQK